MGVMNKVEEMQRELHGRDAWARRWQIEREHNELLSQQADMVRTGVHSLMATVNKSQLRPEGWRAGYAAALRDVVELMETAAGAAAES